MKTKFIIIGVVLIVILFYFVTKSKFNDDILKTNYGNGTNVPSCDFQKEARVYPSGNIPGSYLMLTESEKKMLLKKFIEYSES